MVPTSLASILCTNVVKLRTCIAECFPSADIDITKYTDDNESLIQEMSVDPMNDRLSAGIYNNDKTIWTEYKEHSFCKVLGVPLVSDSLDDTEFEKRVFPYTQTILQFYTIITTAGPALVCFENIARTFISEHPNIPPSEYQQTLLKSLLTNDNIRKQLSTAFSDPNTLSNMFGNIVVLMKGLNINMNTGDSTVTDEPEDIDDLQSDTLSSMIKCRKKKLRTAKLSKRRECPLDAITNMLSNKREMEEVGIEIQKVLCEDNSQLIDNMIELMGDGHGGFDMQKMISQLSGISGNKQLEPFMNLCASKF